MKIKYHRKFIKVFNKLSPKTQKTFYQKLEIFYEDKHDEILCYHQLHGQLDNLFSINITGDYRALFQEKNNIVIFMKIGRHCDLY